MPLFFQRHIFQAGEITPETVTETRAGFQFSLNEAGNICI